MHAEDLEKHPRVMESSVVRWFLSYFWFLSLAVVQRLLTRRLAISLKDLSAQIVLPLLANEYLFKALIHTLDIEAETSSS